ncbi:F-box/FBD-like domain protein, partial [Trifolium pratense]
ITNIVTTTTPYEFVVVADVVVVKSLDKVCVPPSVKRLKIAIDNDVGASLELNAPVIEYLNITNITFGEVFSMNNLPNASSKLRLSLPPTNT